jgi:hypothetical protein
MRIIHQILFLFLSFNTLSQIKGKVIDSKGSPLPFVTLFEENTYNSTTTNEQGLFILNLKNTGKHTLVFQNLGFKTIKKEIDIVQFPFGIEIQMQDESYSLNEVIINTKKNLANSIIKKAIANKKENKEKTTRYTADFYSRGIYKIKNLPKKIIGIKIDIGEEMASNLDSTGSGILYLSETVSKISFESKKGGEDHFKERIIASKISGNNKGFSYNTAKSSSYDFYNNTLNLNIKLISPIADNAFNYYKYKLEGSFLDDNNHQINKIKVIPKRDKEPVFEGYIYIVDNSWAIYALDLDIKGYRMKNEFTEVMNLKQNFSYNAKNKLWSKNTQSLAFDAGAFGIKFSGKFSYVYTNYIFLNSFDKNTFGNEILSFEENANKKEDSFWNTIRPIPLTLEESNDYIKKDSIQTIHTSRKYTDSVDKKNNRYKVFDFATGYNYKNTFKKYSFNYDGLFDLSSLSFNTVQGFNLNTGFTFKKWNEEKGESTTFNTLFNYGFSDNRLRVSAEYKQHFNNHNNAVLTLTGGTKVNQFNSNLPISNFINSISSLFFKNNFMKLYNLEFAQINYGQDVANGVNLNGKLEYQKRKPLFNTTDYSFTSKNDLYSSNNPLNSTDFENAGLEEHTLVKFNFVTRINFGNKYYSRPDGKLNIKNEKYPTVFLGYEKGFAASAKNYEYDLFLARITYDLSLENKGIVGLNLKGGKFINGEKISFIDYKHFNGNQTHIGQSEKYLNVFNLMPYYANSTNDSYFELHTEYDDKGFIMNKIPLLNLLKSNLILGFHNLSVPDRKPYNEVSVGLDNLGFGKFKMLRIDYVRSYQSGFNSDGIIFGLKFLNILE